MAHDREVAGIRCMTVLERLSDYLDGELQDSERDQVDRHLKRCDWCEQFGGRFSEVVTDLGRLLADPAPLEVGTSQRLRRRLGLH